MCYVSSVIRLIQKVLLFGLLLLPFAGWTQPSPSDSKRATEIVTESAAGLKESKQEYFLYQANHRRHVTHIKDPGSLHGISYLRRRMLHGGFDPLELAFHQGQYFRQSVQLARHGRLLRLECRLAQSAGREGCRRSFQLVGLPPCAGCIAILELFSQNAQLRWRVVQKFLDQSFR